MHLVNDLKINILIDNDVLESKLFDISMFNNIVYIENCEIIIFITIAFHRTMQTKFVYLVKLNLISSHFEELIFIHKLTVLNRDYLFEFVQIVNFSIYTHLVNIKINFILIHNNSNKISKIFKSLKFD